MAERPRPPHRPTLLDVDRMTDRQLEMYDVFTPDDEYFTPPISTTVTTTQTSQSSEYSKTDYQSRTLNSYNKARQTILPLFPPRSTLVSMAGQQQRTAAPSPTNVNEEIDFLLCNVPKQLLTFEQYQRRPMNVYISPFELRTWDEIKKIKNYHSFMLTFHRDMYVKLSRQWHIDIPILDYNLSRLYQCAMKNNLHFSFHDLPLALEFYLQMDVDLFHLKTCSFRQGQQPNEGIFATDEQSVEGRFGLTPCQKNNCLCCKNRSSTIQFMPKQIHCFLNQYRAILNCPVTCTTSNIIYALTCPCGEKDYVAHTNLPLADCLLYHRREIVRVIREFLIGDLNVNLIELTSKSDETKENDENWLYQHAARCPVVMQLFLDRNPLYWCFVPEPKDRSLRATTYTESRPLSPSAQIITTTTAMPMVRRSDTLAMRLANNIPAPTGDYVFKHEHFNQQKLFFKYGKDRDPINVHNLNFYNATIVAVLPDHCSDMIKKFVESLFITHGECQLNKDGRLINQHFFHGYPVRGLWYRGLTRRPSSYILS